MGLKLELDNLDGVDDGVKSLYVEKDGKFRLDVEGVEDTTGLKSALEKERNMRREAEKRAKSGLSDEELDEYLKLKADAEKGKSVEERLELERKKSAKEVDLAKQEALAVRQRLETRELTSKAAELVSDAKGNFKLLGPHIMPLLKIEEVDGEFQVSSKSGSSLEEVVSSLKTSFPEAFSDSGHSGGGAGGGFGGGKGAAVITRQQYNTMTPTARRAHVNGGGTVVD